MLDRAIGLEVSNAVTLIGRSRVAALVLSALAPMMLQAVSFPSIPSSLAMDFLLLCAVFSLLCEVSLRYKTII